MLQLMGKSRAVRDEVWNERRGRMDTYAKMEAGTKGHWILRKSEFLLIV